MDISPESAPFHADAAVRVTKETCGIELDYSSHSLEDVDRLIEMLRAEGHEPADMGMSLFVYGCYLGEVMVRNDGAVWHLGADVSIPFLKPDQLVLKLPSGAVCDPIGKVIRRYNNGKEDSLTVFYAAALQLIPDKERATDGEAPQAQGTLPKGPIARAVSWLRLVPAAQIEAFDFVDAVTGDLEAIDAEIAKHRASIEDADEDGVFAPGTSIRQWTDAYIDALVLLRKMIASKLQKGQTWYRDGA